MTESHEKRHCFVQQFEQERSVHEVLQVYDALQEKVTILGQIVAI